MHVIYVCSYAYASVFIFWDFLPFRNYNNTYLLHNLIYFSVVVLCANPDSVRDIMIQAEELNFNNGEYVFLNIDLFSR